MCGVFGIIGADDASYLTSVGLHALQHRGQEAAGMVTFENRRVPGVEQEEEVFHDHRSGGLVGRIFTPAVRHELKGHAAVGHVRYSTAGAKQEDAILQARDAQPVVGVFHFGALAVAHNGNITNAQRLRHSLELAGHTFHARKDNSDEVVDTEVALKLIGTQEAPNLIDRMKMALPLLEGAYSFVMLTKNELIGVCDPAGIRPLFLGKIGSAFVLTSETCALDAVGAEIIREIEPGEIVAVENGVFTSHRFSQRNIARPCIFEYIYFSRPDSVWHGETISIVRERLGEMMRHEDPIDIDIVVPVPDSGNYAAFGYARASGLPLKFAIVRNHYIGRTFIQPTQEMRDRDVNLKHSVIKALVQGKRLAVIDDSAIRGTTSRRLVERLFEAGALEVHWRLSSPPWLFGCDLGIDEADVTLRLGKPGDTLEEVCERLKKATGATSVGYLSLDGMYKAAFANTRAIIQARVCPSSGIKPCDFCFTGQRPVPHTDPYGGWVH